MPLTSYDNIPRHNILAFDASILLKALRCSYPVADQLSDQVLNLHDLAIQDLV